MTEQEAKVANQAKPLLASWTNSLSDISAAKAGALDVKVGGDLGLNLKWRIGMLRLVMSNEIFFSKVALGVDSVATRDRAWKVRQVVDGSHVFVVVCVLGKRSRLFLDLFRQEEEVMFPVMGAFKGRARRDKGKARSAPWRRNVQNHFVRVAFVVFHEVLSEVICAIEGALAPTFAAQWAMMMGLSIFGLRVSGKVVRSGKPLATSAGKGLVKV
ncbi:hypothetical protein EDB80DRAFT_838644 [Ilyonectria destructans]|nr:hypothetical protein EDB80DRAFT_838644 [Ilyonectria destructans]